MGCTRPQGAVEYLHDSCSIKRETGAKLDKTRYSLATNHL
jgi:hypothetical protein